MNSARNLSECAAPKVGFIPTLGAVLFTASKQEMALKRISKVAQEYGGRKVAPGEEFDVEEGHLGLLLALGRIEVEDSSEPLAPSGHHHEYSDMSVQSSEYNVRAMTSKRGRPRRSY